MKNPTWNLKNVPKIWKNKRILGLFINQTCFYIEQYGSNMVWTNVFSMEHGFKNETWNFFNGFVIWKNKPKTFLIDLKLGKQTSNSKKIKFKL